MKQSSRLEIASVVRKIKTKEIDPILGAREIYALYMGESEVSDEEYKALNYFIAFEDDTERFPVEEDKREKYSNDYLAKLDREREELMKAINEELDNECNELINYLKQK